VQDGALVSDGDEVALVVWCSLAEMFQVAGDMYGSDETVRVREVVDVVHPDPGHSDHVQRDGAVVR
jgi:hypothetical protein